MARIQSIKDKQGYSKKYSKLQSQITLHRNHRVNDYLNKVARYLINYCLTNQIGILVFGYKEDFQTNPHIGNVNNQNFVQIPYGSLCAKLEGLCQFYGIQFVKQEESYTSKASFFDEDEIPVYTAKNKRKYTFRGKRVYRGLYETSTGYRFHSDVNGALNILRKSNVVSLHTLCARGVVATPVRIRIA